MATAKEQFEVWSKALSGQYKDGQVDPNSISGVLYDLFWDMATFEAYVALCRDNPKSILASNLFGEMTALNYLQTQALRIRRLTEISSIEIEKKDKSVYSLMNIVNDMKRLRKEGGLTSEYFCEAYSIPAFKEVQTKGMENIAPTWSSIIAANSYVMLERICDKHGLLQKWLLDNLDKRLSGNKNVELSSIIAFVNKRIAHSATDSNREEGGTELELRVKDVREAIKGITEAYFALLMLITQADNLSMIPAGWEDRLNNLTKDEAEIVYKAFKKVEDDCNKWKEAGYALIRAGI